MCSCDRGADKSVGQFTDAGHHHPVDSRNIGFLPRLSSWCNNASWPSRAKRLNGVWGAGRYRSGRYYPWHRRGTKNTAGLNPILFNPNTTEEKHFEPPGGAGEFSHHQFDRDRVFCFVRKDGDFLGIVISILDITSRCEGGRFGFINNEQVIILICLTKGVIPLQPSRERLPRLDPYVHGDVTRLSGRSPKVVHLKIVNHGGDKIGLVMMLGLVPSP